MKNFLKAIFLPTAIVFSVGLESVSAQNPLNPKSVTNCSQALIGIRSDIEFVLAMNRRLTNSVIVYPNLEKATPQNRDWNGNTFVDVELEMNRFDRPTTQVPPICVGSACFFLPRPQSGIPMPGERVSPNQYLVDITLLVPEDLTFLTRDKAAFSELSARIVRQMVATEKPDGNDKTYFNGASFIHSGRIVVDIMDDGGRHHYFRVDVSPREFNQELNMNVSRLRIAEVDRPNGPPVSGL